MKSIMYKIKQEHFILRLVLLVLALLILAIAYNLFLVPNDLVTGGSSGLSIIFKRCFGIDESLFIFIFSVITLILSYIFLNKDKSNSEVITVFVYPLLVKLTTNYGNYINVSTNSLLVTVVIAAVLFGISTGIILKIGFSNTGVSAACLICSEKFKLSYSKMNFIFNFIIVFVGGLIFGFSKVIYAIIFLVVQGYVINKITLGISNTKSFYIVTGLENSVKKFIINDLKYGCTELSAHSAKSDKSKKVIMCVIPTKDYPILKKGIRKIDENAFFLITDAYESFEINQEKILE